MPGRERLRKLKSRRVVHKSTGGVLPRTPQPVDPVGNPPPPSPLNTVAHLPAATPAGLLSRKITGEVSEAAAAVQDKNKRTSVTQPSPKRTLEQNGDGRKFSWYEPLRDRDAIRRGVHFVLSRPGLFLNTSSDATLLRDILDAATMKATAPARAEMEADVERYALEPLFIPGVSDSI